MLWTTSRTTIKNTECWENIEIENNYGENVCINCGQVDRYEIVNEFIDFMRIDITYSENQFTIESITFVIQLAVSAVRITYR